MRPADATRKTREPTLADLQREHGHPPATRRAAPAEAAEHAAFRNYVRDMVLGFNDGLVSVYAVTAGVAGAAFLPRQILIAGLAASVAGALSMAAGEWISTKSQAEYYRSERRREAEHLRHWPQVEREELVESLRARGLEPPLLDEVADTIAADHDRFLDYMMREEFGVGQESERSPWAAAGLVIVAFLVGAAFPVAPYAWSGGTAALASSSGLSLVALFAAGALRARVSRLPMLRAGLEMVLVGALAAAATFGVGRLVGAQL